MGSKSAFIVSATALLSYLGFAIMSSNWDRIEKENNASAKDCNDRGGMVIFGMHARQCIGAGPAMPTDNERGSTPRED